MNEAKRTVVAGLLLGLTIMCTVSVLIFDSFVWDMPWWGWIAYIAVLFLAGMALGQYERSKR